MKKSMFLICQALCCMTFCFAQKENKIPITQVEWLQGNWQGTYKNAPFYEAWRKATDSVLMNFTIEIKGTDTIVKENGAILLMKQNRGYRSPGAKWDLESLTDDKVVFRNDTLKYSNRIVWSHSANDHWLTELHNPDGSIVYYDLVRVSWLEDVVNRFIRNARRQ